MSTVSMKFVGLEKSVETADWPEVTKAAIWAYGVRRWFQDHGNSQAKICRDAGETPDAEALFKARLEQATSGNIAKPRKASGVPGMCEDEKALCEFYYKTLSKTHTFAKKKAEWIIEVRDEMIARKSAETWAEMIADKCAKREAEEAELAALVDDEA